MSHFSRILLISFICFQLLAQRSSASHMMGGEITYRSLGNDKFQITVKVYRDCNGITMSNTPILVIPQGGQGSTFSKSLKQISITDITPVCISVQTKCSGGSYQYGSEEYLYRDTIDLISYTNTCSFIISWEQAARNGSITTGQANENFLVTAKLNKCATNSSVIFTTKPHIILICTGQDLSHNIGAIDTMDHDSLSFMLDTALQAVNGSATYSGSYAYNRPLHFLDFPNQNSALPAGFHLDAQNGDLRFRSTQAQVGVVVIKVIEWRNINGTITSVGETRRDIQVISTSCPSNNIPSLQGPYAYDVNPSQQLCFNVTVTDPNATDTVLLSWNQGIPDGTFITTFSPVSYKDQGTFCWTPDNSDVRNTPYFFTVTARDGACPLNGISSRIYKVTVKAPGNTGSGTKGIEKQYVNAYPNPASKTFNVMLNNTGDELFTLAMYDIAGKKLKEQSGIKSGVSAVNCEELSAGMYFITVTGSTGHIYRSRVVLE